MKTLAFFLIFSLLFSSFALADEQTQVQDEPGKWYQKPFSDWDNDAFPPEKGWRGANWRGKDANDDSKAIHPGIQGDSRDGKTDNNCNGIFGWAPGKGKTYEELFCSKSDGRGVVIFGDSAAAAFHIPPKWLEIIGLTEEYRHFLDFEWIREQALNVQQNGTSRNEFLTRIEANLPESARKDDFWSIVAHELDWPHKSWATGFSEDINGESIYSKMRERNHCNHRDFQNLAVNGAKAKDLRDQVAVLSRTPEDRPVLGFVAYIGNDICKKKLADMTQVDEFRGYILEGLEDLNKKVAPGSKIVLIGLVDGRILWDTMKDRQHPLGVTYSEFYNFLHSIRANPCRTWLTPDEETRNRASARARELSNVLKEIAETKSYSNFELLYLDLPMEKVIADWQNNGGEVADLIEVVDGFHPSHTCHRELFKAIWEDLENNHPSFIGPENPFNTKIRELFGDQGGH